MATIGAVTAQENITPSQSVDLVDGFLEGTGCSGKIEQCIDNVPQVQTDVEQIATDCGAKLASMQCVSDIGGLVNDIVSAAGQCKDVDQDLARLELILKKFEDPLGILAHLATDIFHIGKYTDEFNAATDAWNNNDFKGCGQHFGKLTTMIANVKSTSLQAVPEDFKMPAFGKQQLAEFVTGYYEANNVSINLAALLDCIHWED